VFHDESYFTAYYTTRKRDFTERARSSSGLLPVVRETDLSLLRSTSLNKAKRRKRKGKREKKTASMSLKKKKSLSLLTPFRAAAGVGGTYEGM